MWKGSHIPRVDIAYSRNPLVRELETASREAYPAKLRSVGPYCWMCERVRGVIEEKKEQQKKCCKEKNRKGRACGR